MVAVVACIVLGAGGPVVQLPFGEPWSMATQGAWSLRVDHRSLLAMAYPSAPDEPETSASYTRLVTVPNDWSGPILLLFYCSDDIATTDSAYTGRRRKQVLIDGNIAWTSDVCDDRGAATYHAVPVPVEPGQPFSLTLLGYSASASSDDTPRAPFVSCIYWGDVALAQGDVVPPPQARPSHGRVRDVHERRWPLPSFATPSTDTAVDLEVAIAEPWPKQGFPLTFGLPLPPAKVNEVNGVRLRLDGKTLLVQTAALGWWPDESLQWLLVDFVAKPAMDNVRLEFRKGTATPSGKLTVTETDTDIDVKGGVEVVASLGRLLHTVRTGDDSVDEILLRLKSGGATASGTADELLVWDRGPIRSTVLIQGHFAGESMPALPFHLYASVYAGLPYLKLWLRVFNDTGASVPISGLEAAFKLSQPHASLTTPVGVLAAGDALSQTAANTRQLADTQVDPSSPMVVGWPGGAVVVKHFRERFPRALRFEDNALIVDCMAATDAPVYISPGEATSHELWLALGDVDPAALANAVAHPPILHNPEYFCGTGAFGPAATLAEAPELASLQSIVDPVPTWEALGQQFGVRDFPDSPFIGGLPNWSNNYYERMLGLWSAWLLTGNRTWFEYATDTCRHLMDVAVIHADIPDKDWAGAIHGPGPNHVAGPWNPLLRAQGLSFFQLLTGDPEAREAVHGLTDFCVRSRAGMDGPNPRHQAAPLDTIATAYAETGEVELLAHGSERVEAVLRHMDMRRGIWIGDDALVVVNNPVYAAQLARSLYLWYRATGDVAAAEALVGLADAILCENVPWDAPGSVAPLQDGDAAVDARNDLLILPMLFAAYELTEDTFFQEQARKLLERWQQKKPAASPLYGFWHTPWLASYLRKPSPEPAK